MDTEFIKESQKKINSLMTDYECLTRDLLECDDDDILALTQKRQTIIEKILELDDKIKRNCSDNALALAAYLNKCERNGIPDYLLEIFDLRQEFNAMAFRVKNAEPEIIERISILRGEMMEKIKKNNSGQNAKAAKYAGVGMPSDKAVFISENKKQI